MEDYVNYKKNEKLTHLTDEQIEDLIKRYYDGEKTTDLIKEYNIDIQSGKLYTLFPPLVCEDKVCPNCNVQLSVARQSRTSYSYSFSRKDIPYCPLCNHTDTPNCKCPSCSEIRRLEKKEREEQERIKKIKQRELINVTYSLDRKKAISLNDLTFKDKLYLGALLRLCLSENFTIINAYNNVEGELAPTNELTKDIITSLSNKGIIVVHPNSPIEAFTESEDSPFPNVYYIYDVNYHLNMDSSDSKQKLISDLLNPPEFSKVNSEEAYNIWRDIALAECLEYFKFQMDKVKFEFKPGEKTIAVFHDLLNNFSVSQIYGIIYKSVANGTKFYQENNISRKQAANSVIGNCQRYAEKALLNNWDITKYSRIIECPQTMISEFFFNRVLKIGTLGFDMPPTML